MHRAAKTSSALVHMPSAEAERHSVLSCLASHAEVTTDGVRRGHYGESRKPQCWGQVGGVRIPLWHLLRGVASDELSERFSLL